MITPLGAAQAIKYLHAAGAMNVVDDQEVVWADYLNSDMGGCEKATDADLLPAARHLIREWNNGEAKYRRNVNVDDFAWEVRRAHRMMLDERAGIDGEVGSLHPTLTPSFADLNLYYVPGNAWHKACRVIAETVTDKREIWKLAADKVMADFGASLDGESQQPDWVIDVYGVGIRRTETKNQLEGKSL